MHTMDTDDARLVGPALEFLGEVFEECPVAGLALRLWDGTVWSAGGEPRFTLVLYHPAALRTLFWRPDQITLGEAYIYGAFDIEGDIVAAFALADRLLGMRVGLRERLRFGRFLRKLPKEAPPADHRKAHLHGMPHSRRRDRQAVGYHYNVSNDFFRLWLDERMVYSCGYFTTPGDSLDAAQEQKLDYVCRKLRLAPGERLLDIGCGWGSLIVHAVRNYGVTALGITLSPPQAELAAERIARAGVTERCRVEVRDYREMAGAGEFDKLVSVGMIEHVGRKRLGEYFRQGWELLRPGGLFLNQGIAASFTTPPPGGPSFVDTYVFPDGDLPPIGTVIQAAEGVGFEPRDLENLREHYALTLRHWIRRLEARHEEARQATDEVTYRIWRLYMAGSAHGFDSGWVNLHQLLLVKPDRGKSGLPLTREEWYR